MTSTRRMFLAHSSAAAALSQANAAAPATEPPRRSLLASGWPAGKLAGVLVPRPQWQPYPTAADRSRWESLTPGYREALVQSGARQLGAEWRSLPATLFLEFARNGNRSNYQAVYRVRRNRLRDLVLAECVEGKGRFLDEIANGIWLTCEETFWGVPAHLGMQQRRLRPARRRPNPSSTCSPPRPASLLAWTDYLLGARLDRSRRSSARASAARWTAAS